MQYAQKDNRIELYLNDENVGYIKNFEKLLIKSKAEYIMFCDHDDIWYKEKVQQSLEKLIESDVDLVYVNARQIDPKGNIVHENYLNYKNLPMLKGKGNILPFSRHIAIGCSQIFTKQVKEKMLPFKESVMAHDWINTYIASEGKGIDFIDEPLLDYRIHNSNVFGGRNLKQNLEKWKKENGKNINSYMKYRNKAITDAYLNGSKMCNEYIKKDINSKVLKYYEKVKNTKIINLRIDLYFKYLGFKGIGKRAIKEILLFHFPIISSIWFLII